MLYGLALYGLALHRILLMLRGEIAHEIISSPDRWAMGGCRLPHRIELPHQFLADFPHPAAFTAGFEMTRKFGMVPLPFVYRLADFLPCPHTVQTVTSIALRLRKRLASMARALCKRERTVPTGQSMIRAASS